MNSSVLKNRSPGSARPSNVQTTSIASILRPSSEENDGDGPYFDLEFSIPEQDEDSTSDDNDLASEKLRSNDSTDDLFLESHSLLLFTPRSKRQLPSSILQSATKFRVFMLRFKKSMSIHLDSSQSAPNNNKKFPVKFKLEEVPIVSLFTKENSSSRSSSRSAKLHAEEAMQSPAMSFDEKRNPKDVILRYLNKIKPLYDRASKRNNDKVRFSGQITAGDPDKRAHSRKLKKSRSASATVAAVRSSPTQLGEAVILEDGIQSAIAHCKRSFSAGSDLGLERSRSDPGTERCD